MLVQRWHNSRLHRLGPWNRNAPVKNRPSIGVNDENQAKQDEPGGPSLTMPIIIRSDGVSKDHNRQACGGLIPAGAPETIAKGSKKERGGFPSDAGEGQQNGGGDAAVGRGHDDAGDMLPTAGAQGHGGLAQNVWHGAEKIFRAGQGGWDHHQGKKGGSR